MAENLNNGAEQNDSTRHHHHHHHHHSSADGSSSLRHHHHHSSVRLVKGKRAGRLPWAEGLGMILICLVLFFVIVMCSKLVL